MSEFKYRPDIDGLRGIAVVLVLLFHTQLGFSGGFIGVDVFFVISGFLITGLILKEQQAGTFRLTNFWARRIRRIIPACCAVVFATLIAGSLLLFPSDYEELAKSTIAQQLLLSNVYFWRNTGYFESSAETMPLLHTWSLAVEEQFYLAYPFLFVLFRRSAKKTIPCLLGAISVGSLALSEWGLHNHAGATFYLLPTRAWELLMGGLLSFAPSSSMLSRWQSQFLSLVGMTGIIGSAWYFDSNMRFPGAIALVPCLATALVIYCNSGQLTWVGRLLTTRPLVLLGLISYSLYLWHWPILAFSRYWLGTKLTLPVTMIALVASLPLAYLSWRFVEMPLRRGRPVVRQRQLLLAILATIPTLLVASLAVIAYRGFPNRVSSTALHYRAAKDSKQFIREVQIEQVKRGLLPTFGLPHAELKCLVWGDSHAMAYLPGIDAACKSTNVQGFQATHSLTAPILDFVRTSKAGGRGESPDFNRAVLDFAVANHIDVVVLSAMWSLYVPNPTFEEQLGKTIDELHQAGIVVAITLDVASYEEDVPMALARQIYFDLPANNAGIPLDDKTKMCNAVIHKVANGKAIILDPAPYFVDDAGLWRSVIDGAVIYRDNHHLTVEGALRLKPLYEQLFETARGK